ncbi:hypothetical protein CHU98_g4534 [Xylaria longipes]|nr:hypothetical protein CHU98_g4534 [Xylaria longipes]
MPFPFNQLPTELRLEIWSFAVQADAQRRRFVEQNLQVFPTLDLVASPFFSVNTESREIVQTFYPIRLEVYRRYEPGSQEAAAAAAGRPPDRRGFVYLSPELDDMVSVYRRATLYDSELTLVRSERSKMTAMLHSTGPMSEETRRLFRRRPDRWCLTRYASLRLGVQDWTEVHEWMLAFDEEEYRGALRLLRSMRINTLGFGQVIVRACVRARLYYMILPTAPRDGVILADASADAIFTLAQASSADLFISYYPILHANKYLFGNGLAITVVMVIALPSHRVDLVLMGSAVTGRNRRHVKNRGRYYLWIAGTLLSQMPGRIPTNPGQAGINTVALRTLHQNTDDDDDE